LLDSLVATVERQLGCLITTSAVARQLDLVAERYPALQGEVAARFSHDTLAEVLQGLAAEHIPIYDLRSILERLLTTNGVTVASHRMQRIVFLPETAHFCHASKAQNGATPTMVELIDSVRCGLTRQISEMYRHEGWLQAMLMHPEVESRFAASSYTKLEPYELRLLFQEASRIRVEWRRQNPESPARPVVLVTAEVRSAVSNAFATAFPDLPVLAYQELSPDVSINTIGRLDMPELSPACQQIRDQLVTQDEAIDNEVQRQLPGGEPDAMLENLAALTALLRKFAARKEQLSAATSNAIREFLTEELCRVEDEMNEREYGQTDTSVELSDMLSDFLEQQKKS
jgi:flagellar biosynthesis component FlhA